MVNLALEILLVLNIVGISDANWNEWWTYDGISGPSYWGVINPDWNMCSKGKQQSPVNIDPDQLIYDEKLTKQQFLVDKQQISGSLHNTGQTLVFKIDADRAAKMPVNITGGPLSYRYVKNKEFFLIKTIIAIEIFCYIKNISSFQGENAYQEMHRK